MEEKEMSGFTAEGRKLRPRRPRISSSSKVYESSAEYSPKSSEGYPARRPYAGTERNSYGTTERRNFGERRERVSGSYDRNYGEQRSSYRSGGSGRYDNNGYSQRPERKPYGNRSEGRPYGENRSSYNGEGKSYGENRSYGNRTYGERSYGERSYGENRSYGERKSYGEGRSYGRPSGERSYNDGESRPQRRPQGNSRFSKGGYDRQGGFKTGGRSFNNNRRPNNLRKKPSAFGKSTTEGINRMLSRNPILDQMQYSDNDYVNIPIQEEIRLNKFIANSGICSRREADQFIQAGVVSVNGEVVTELGTKVNILKDEVKFNDEVIKGEDKVYIVMNKPAGYVTTASDPHAEKTVMDLLKGCMARVFPVGRLDKNTTGVLMFTNDGEMAEKLTHPSYNKKKIYQVSLDKPLEEQDFEKIKAGIELSDGEIKADELEYIDPENHKKVGIEIHSGKNRIVRRIFESLGYDVKALDRVYFAGLTKKGLKKGQWRFLSEGEANLLKMGAYV